jgi:hypothetical protein
VVMGRHLVVSSRLKMMLDCFGLCIGNHRVHLRRLGLADREATPPRGSRLGVDIEREVPAARPVMPGLLITALSRWSDTPRFPNNGWEPPGIICPRSLHAGRWTRTLPRTWYQPVCQQFRAVSWTCAATGRVAGGHGRGEWPHPSGRSREVSCFQPGGRLPREWRGGRKAGRELFFQCRTPAAFSTSVKT